MSTRTFATGMMSKNKPFLKLLGLAEGEYEIDGCMIGISQTLHEPRKEQNIDDFVTWVR